MEAGPSTPIENKGYIIGQRWVFAVLALLAVANAYTMRVCLNIAITQMAAKKKTVKHDPYACTDPDDPKPTLRVGGHKGVQFDWNEATQGVIISSFYYGYVVTHIPGGMLAERFGGKWVLGIGLLSTAVCTLLTPEVTKLGGAGALIVLRIIEGLGEGPTMPGLMAMMSRWAPKAERARFGAIIFGGAQIGNIAGNLLAGYVMHHFVWDWVFYMFGAGAVIWFLFWVAFCYSTPNTHPFISQGEKEFLNQTVDSLAKKDQVLDPVPWKALLRSVPLWALIIAAIGHDWGYFTMVSDLPKYMTGVLRYDIKKAGIFSSAPYIAMWISSFIFALLCDFLIKKKIHNIANARKIYTTIAATGPGICIILASYSGCEKEWAVGFFVLAMTLMGAYYSGMKINPLDISPNYAGTTTSLVNGVAAFAAIVVPILIGLLTPDSTMHQWRIAFWVCLVLLVSTNIVYIFLAQGTQEWWDDVKQHGYPPGWKHGPLPSAQDQQTEPKPK